MKSPLRILITAGPTREPIDDVRYLSNISTGATGVQLALAGKNTGHTVTLVLGIGATHSVPLNSGVSVVRFNSTQDLENVLKAELNREEYDLVIHAAAVSDYTIDTPVKGKLPSDGANTLQLVPTTKLLPQLKSWSKGTLRVIGFKFCPQDQAIVSVDRLFARGGVDQVIQNSLEEYSSGQRVFRVYSASSIHENTSSQTLSSVEALAQYLFDTQKTSSLESPSLCAYSSM